MADTGHFVRIRGKVSGPFDVGNLQKMVRRGALSRMHEISSDRQSWAPAGDFEELFPRSPAAVSTVESEPEAVDFYDVAPTAPTPAARSGSYFYVQNGVTVGPVPLAVLQSLAQNGTIGARDVCWLEGAELASVAGQLPALAPIFSGNTSAFRGQRSPAANVAHTRAPGGTVATTGWSQQVGTVVAALLLLLLNLPIGTVHDRTVWWWNALSEPNSGTVVVVLFFVLMSALIVGPIASLTKGLIRAWFFVGIASLSFALFLALGFNSVGDGSYFFSLIVPYCAAALLGISASRRLIPESRAGAIFQGIAGAVLLFAIVVLGIAGMVNNRSVPEFGSQLPGWVVLVITMGIVSAIAGAAAGILGLIGLRQTFISGVNGATIGCCVGVIALPMLAIVIAAAGGISEILSDNAGIAMFLVIRICCAFLCYVALMATGVNEMFLSYVSQDER